MPQKFNSIFNYQKTSKHRWNSVNTSVVIVNSASSNPFNFYYVIEKRIKPVQSSKNANFYASCILFLNAKNNQAIYKHTNINHFFKSMSIQLGFDAITIFPNQKLYRNNSWNRIVFFKYFNYHFKNDNSPLHAKSMFNKLARRSYQRKQEVIRVGHFMTTPNQIIFSKIFYNNNFSKITK